MRGLILVGGTVAVLEASTGAVGLLMLGPVEIALYLLVCALATVGVTALAAYVVASHRRDDDDEGPGGEGGDDPEPPWWPGFERDFRRYARERERTRRRAPA